MTYNERLEILKTKMDWRDANHHARNEEKCIIYEIEELKKFYDDYLSEIFICGETDKEEIANLKAQFDLLLEGRLTNDYWITTTANGKAYAINFIL